MSPSVPIPTRAVPADYREFLRRILFLESARAEPETSTLGFEKNRSHQDDDEYSRELAGFDHGMHRYSELTLGSGHLVTALDEDKSAWPEQAPRDLIEQEPARDFHVALLVRMGHARSVFPSARPLDRFGEIHRIFDGSGVDQRFSVRAEAESFDQPFLSAAG